MKHQSADGLNSRAVVLLSGGLDSATVLAEAGAQGFELYALTVEYGQRHSVEIDAARRVAEAIGVHRHVITRLNLQTFGGSALTDDIDVPKDTPPDVIGTEIPVTYVPARNTIFLSLAMAWAETLGASDLFIGVNALDYSGYPDCRPEFIEAFERLAAVATKAGVGGASLEIHTPLMQMTKSQIIRRGVELGVDYGVTVSCYDPSAEGAACGRCDACVLRRKGFEEAGVPDPTPYRAGTHV
jgi:7-cyano-7-deazaguanine synthase